MQNLPMDVLVNKTGSIYKLVRLASLRAIELNGGAAKLVDTSLDAKATSIALKEILEDKVEYKIKEAK